MNLIIRTLALVFTLLAGTSVLASTHTGKIKKLYVRASDGLVYFNLDTSAPNDKPACATKSYWMIKDENSEAGKKQYSMILAAHAAGREITVSGTGECTRWGDGEDVDSIVMLPNE